jgi:2-methylisocitrate lyase-like PEP mutase family enzyme
MPTTPKILYRGAASTSTGTTLYTVPASTTTIVTSIVITNTAASAGTFTLALGGTNLATTVSVGANDSTVLDLKQVLTATQTITGGASATTINFHISGVEVA